MWGRIKEKIKEKLEKLELYTMFILLIIGAVAFAIWFIYKLIEGLLHFGIEDLATVGVFALFLLIIHIIDKIEKGDRL